MSDFPWQKKNDEESTFSWDRRMPWDKDESTSTDLTPPEADPPITDEAAAPALVSDDNDVAEFDADEPELDSAEAAYERDEPAADTELEPEIDEYIDELDTDEWEPAPDESGATPAVQMMPAVPMGSPGTVKKASGGRGAGAMVVGLFVAIIAITGIIIFASSTADDFAYEVDDDFDPVDDIELVEVADAFMTAIMETDLEAALALTNWDPEQEDASRGVFLTEEVLQASQELAPISNVTFGEVTFPNQTQYSGEVSVEYMLGDDLVEAQIPLTTDYQGGWMVKFSGSSLTLPAYWQAERSVNMFDIPMTNDYPLYVLPGRYSFEIVDDMPLSFYDRPGVNIAGPTTATLDLPTSSDETLLTLAVTEARAAEYWDLVEASLEECIATTASTTPCTTEDYSAYDTKDLKSGTVVRSIAADSEHRSTMPTTKSDSDRSLIAFDMIKVTYEAECVNGAECTGWDFTRYPIVDYSGEEPVVTWEYLS